MYAYLESLYICIVLQHSLAKRMGHLSQAYGVLGRIYICIKYSIYTLKIFIYLFIYLFGWAGS